MAAAALAAGLRLEAVADSLGRSTALSKWRMELHERADGLVVINDAYNANPDSVAAGLHTLAEIGVRTGRPTAAVLGEMRELGESSAAEHVAIGVLAGSIGIGRLFVVGEGARTMTEGNDTAVFYASVPDAVDGVRKNVDGAHVVLVKASRAAGLERVADALLSDDHKEDR